jgi:cytochrome-b5 reductase
MRLLTLGATVEMMGPRKKLAYEKNRWSHIGFVAGGTGITPCYQVLTEILQNKVCYSLFE